jgi:hypothetical protein
LNLRLVYLASAQINSILRLTLSTSEQIELPPASARAGISGVE